jgi:hypothetical protein
VGAGLEQGDAALESNHRRQAEDDDGGELRGLASEHEAMPDRVGPAADIAHEQHCAHRIGDATGGVIEAAATPLQGYLHGFELCAWVQLAGGILGLLLLWPESERARFKLVAAQV